MRPRTKQLKNLRASQGLVGSGHRPDALLVQRRFKKGLYKANQAHTFGTSKSFFISQGTAS